MTTSFLSSPTSSFSRLAAATALAALSTASAFAAPSAGASDAEARYKAERAKCMSGTSNQDRATCLKEAGAARDEARRQRLDDVAPTYQQNAKARCNALSGDDLKDCLARIQGAGTTSGNAESGGVYRETRTREVKPAAPVASMAPSH